MMYSSLLGTFDSEISPMECWKMFHKEFQEMGTVPAMIEKQKIPINNTKRMDIVMITGNLLDIAYNNLSGVKFEW